MATDIIGGNMLVQGTLTASGFVAPSGCISPSNIATPAAGAAGIDSSKLNHRFHVPYNQPEGTAGVSGVHSFDLITVQGGENLNIYVNGCQLSSTDTYSTIGSGNYQNGIFTTASSVTNVNVYVSGTNVTII